ncbi:queuosine salvage family protein [Candidatus Acetothermia bacterium]|jgi:hypothetical protein|nr:queuosine salvage family protein [Candidatus Acetothermia bacterium]MCI2430935.1 queuosine salvage family protein [Candidatus Acetothermia bacterium]MCI2437043.1 queuosine salvage family protein [Candidatus Acetothermia bacterium]
MQEVRESVRRVIAQNSSVSLDEHALGTGARLLAGQEPRLLWDSQHHFFDGTERTVQYLFILDALNFCFWPEPRWRYRYEGELLNGYLALASALKDAVARDATVLEAAFLAQMSEHRLREILSGENVIPLLTERVAVLQEAGAVLQAQYHGQAVNLVEEAECSTERLVKLLAENFSSFRDEAIYRGERVYFYKRAQIFCADLYGAFGGQRWGRFRDIEKLTAFADYKLPQVLRHLGILRYSPALAHKIDRREELLAGSEEEIEIRAHTIWAVELLQRELNRLGRAWRSFEIDWLLWNLGQREEFCQKPSHRTRTIFY